MTPPNTAIDPNVMIPVVTNTPAPIPTLTKVPSVPTTPVPVIKSPTPAVVIPTPTVTLTEVVTVDVTVTDLVIEVKFFFQLGRLQEGRSLELTTWQTKKRTTTLTSIETLSCLTSAIGSFSFPTALPEKKETRKRSFHDDILKDIGVSTDVLLHHHHDDDDDEWIARPDCIPPTWDEVLVSKACACMVLPKPSCTTTVTRTAQLSHPTIAARRENAAANKPCITEVVTNTVTNTITKTSTSTVTEVETAHATATDIASGGTGLHYKRFVHTFPAKPNSGFTASFFKRRTPLAEGFLRTLEWASPDWPTGPYTLGLPSLSATDREQFEATQAAVVAQGFFVARAGSGTYTFIASPDTVDNWEYLWLGEDAYCDWADANAAFRAMRGADGKDVVGGRFSVDLEAGDAVPLTWLWANGGAAARSDLRVGLPDGTVTDDLARFFVRACGEEVFKVDVFV